MRCDGSLLEKLLWTLNLWGPSMMIFSYRVIAEDKREERGTGSLSCVEYVRAGHIWLRVKGFDGTCIYSRWARVLVLVCRCNTLKFRNYKLMFNCIYHVIWLYDWLEWVKVWCELVMCHLIDVDVELCGVLLT